LGFDVPQAQRERWEFLKLEDLMKQPPQGNPLIRQLKVSDRLFGKIWLLSPPVRMIGGMAVLGILALLGAFIWKVWLNPLPSFSWGELIIFFIAIGFGVFTFNRLSSAFNYRKTLDQVLIGVGLMLGSLLAKVHLHIFDKIFLRQGKIDRLLSRNKNRGDV
jgi:hypothetical protein